MRRYRSTARHYFRPGFAHLFMYVTGRFMVMRKLGVAVLRRGSRPAANQHPGLPSQLKPVEVSDLVERLERDGVALGLRLREETLRDLNSFCDTAPCFGNNQRSQPFFIQDKAAAEKQYGAKFVTGAYFDCEQTAPTVRSLLKDPLLKSIARAYLGAEPVVIGARIWWSFAGESSAQEKMGSGQAFHYDLDDYRAICFFFYLTDVDEDSGAHVCVVGSHRRKPLRFLLSPFKAQSDEDIEVAYGKDSFKTLFGAAGDGFAEDIFCYHKGRPPRSNDRLLLQIRYRLREYGPPGPDE